MPSRKPYPNGAVKPNKRPMFVSALSKVIQRELQFERSHDSRLTDRFENLKIKLRLLLTETELEELAVMTAATVVDANYLVKLTMIRQADDNHYDHRYTGHAITR